MLSLATQYALTAADDSEAGAMRPPSRLAIYAVVALFALVLVGFLAAAHVTNVGMIMGDAISQAAP